VTVEALQREICNRYGSVYLPSSVGLKVGIALGTLKFEPIYGVREPMEGDTNGWYIWAGPHSDDVEFYQALHVEHLAEIFPIVLPYLALSVGFRFIIDASGYEDVWYDPYRR
jgi:hypothetical protein